MGRPRKSEPKTIVSPPVEPEPVVSLPPAPFSTTDLRITDHLNKQGIGPVACTGSPMVFYYSPEKTDAIKASLKEAGLE